VEQYTVLERPDAIKKEIERLERWAADMEKYLRSGNPLPWWVAVILGAGLVGAIGAVLYTIWGSAFAVTQAVQQAAPVMGAALSAFGIMMTVMPLMLMMFMMVQMFASIISAFLR